MPLVVPGGADTSGLYEHGKRAKTDAPVEHPVSQEALTPEQAAAQRAERAAKRSDRRKTETDANGG